MAFQKKPKPKPKPPTLIEGQITRIAPQRRDPTRVSIYIHDQFAFGLAKDIVLLHSLSKGTHLNIEQQKEFIEADQLLHAKTITLDYIASQPRTEKEVSDKLRDKGFANFIIEAVLVRFRELDYLNDERYARTFANSRLKQGGYGPKRIRLALNKKGVPREHIQLVLEELAEQDTAITLVAAKQKATRRWLRASSKSPPFKARKQVMDFLARRGFSYDHIREIMEEVEQHNEAPEPDMTDTNNQSFSSNDDTPAKTEQEMLEELRPLAEKRWERLRSEPSKQKRRKKFSDFLLRRGASYDHIKTLLEELPEHEPAPIEDAVDDEPVDPLEELRPLAEKRWERLRSEPRQKRRKKFSDFLLRRGVSYDHIKELLQELEAA